MKISIVTVIALFFFGCSNDKAPVPVAKTADTVYIEKNAPEAHSKKVRTPAAPKKDVLDKTGDALDKANAAATKTGTVLDKAADLKKKTDDILNR